MQKLFVVELMAIMLILLVRKGQSFKCYSCRSDIDRGCNGEINTSLAIECPARENGSNAYYCRKIHQKVKFKNEANWTIIRECAYEKGLARCYHFKWLNLGYQETCECPEEVCNGGNSFISNVGLLAVLLFTLGIFNYLICDNT